MSLLRGRRPRSLPRAWGRITATGNLVNGRGITSVTHTRTGVYDVEFSRPFPKTTRITITETHDSTPGLSQEDLSMGTDTFIQVLTFDTSGSPLDLPFTIQVTS